MQEQLLQSQQEAGSFLYMPAFGPEAHEQTPEGATETHVPGAGGSAEPALDEPRRSPSA